MSMKSRSQLGQQGHCIQAVVEVREWSCVGDLAEFVAPGQLKLLIACNFSRSNLMCLGMWLQSALRNTSSSMVTLIPPFLFSHVKNKEERNPAFVGRMLCLCHFPQGTTTHTKLPAPGCEKPEHEHLPRHQDCRVLQGLLGHLPLSLGQPKCPGLGDRSHSFFILHGERGR